MLHDLELLSIRNPTVDDAVCDRIAAGFGYRTTRWTIPDTEQVGLAPRNIRGLNYIRNSVKVVVDMYDGTVRFFVMDPKDPVLAAYRLAFPAYSRTSVKYPRI